MLLTSLYVDNLFTFSDASLDLTYQRPLSCNPIPNEWLVDRPKFYLKKVIVLSGANASGKTSLGKLIFLIQSMLHNPATLVDALFEKKYYKDQSAKLVVEFATHHAKHTLHRLSFILEDKASVYYQSSYIGVNDSAGVARKKLEQDIPALFTKENFYQLAEKLAPHMCLGWYYLFSENIQNQHTFNHTEIQVDVLRAVLQSFDNSISEVLLSQDDKGINGFSIHFNNGDVVLVDKSGHATGAERLSRGTYDALGVAHMVSWVMGNTTPKGDSIYFLDEKMAYSHSEMEQAIVNLIIEKLPINAQFFYTTHNYDVLDMNLPVHSLVFLTKKAGRSEVVQPEHTFKKNDRSLVSYIKNNVFKTLPSTRAIDALL